MTFASLLLTALLQISQPARISTVSGEAELLRGADAVLLKIGDTLEVGDRLHTRPNASVVLSTSNGVTVQLNPNTRLELKKLEDDATVLLVEGSLNVRSGGKPVRVETHYGAFVSSADSPEFEVKYGSEGIQVTTGRAVRVYEAGSISPTTPRKPSETTVIVYPETGNRGRDRRDTRPAPSTPPPPAR